MKKQAMRSVAVFGLLLCFLAVAGCNTMKGLGKDIEKAGEKLSDAADRAND